MNVALALVIALGLPSIRVDGSALADDANARRTVGHVVERLLEVGIAVDPKATTSLVLAPTATGFFVHVRASDAGTDPLASSEVVDHGGGTRVVELDLVQVAVDLALAHATAGEASDDAVRIVALPGAEDDRADVLAAVLASGRAMVPSGEPSTRVLCVERREDGVRLAAEHDPGRCADAVSRVDVHDTMDAALVAALAPAKPGPTVAPVATRPATRAPATTRKVRRREPWSMVGGVGIGFAWRPEAFDVAPSLDFEAASKRGLAIGFASIFVPSRGSELRVLDTMLAAGAGYRARLGSRARLTVLPSAGVSVHAAWRTGEPTIVRADPLLMLPLTIEGLPHENVALGGRLAVATTLRARTHSVRGLELWHRGAVVLMASAVLRFGT
jgi:hypothetical protein